MYRQLCLIGTLALLLHCAAGNKVTMYLNRAAIKTPDVITEIEWIKRYQDDRAERIRFKKVRGKDVVRLEPGMYELKCRLTYHDGAVDSFSSTKMYGRNRKISVYTVKGDAAGEYCFIIEDITDAPEGKGVILSRWGSRCRRISP